MQHYRAYFLDRDGHISNAIDMECTDANKQRNALRNSYPTAMPSFGKRIGLLRYTPREGDHYHRLIISSVSHDSKWTLSS